MQLTDEQRQNIVDAAIEQIKTKAIENTVNDLARYTTSTVASVIDKEISEFIKAEIVPSLKEELLKHKATLIDAALVSAEEISKKLSEAMLKKLTDKLSRDYEVSNIFKTMFGY